MEKVNSKKASKVKKERIHPVMIVVFVILCLWSLILISFLLWGLMTTFKDNFNDFSENVMGLPKKWILDNYKLVWKEFYVVVSRDGGKRPAYVEEMFAYALFYVLTCAFTTSFVPMVSAYVCSKYPNWISSKVIYTIVILCMTIPVIGSTASELNMLMRLNVYNKLWVGPFCKSSFLGMYFIMFYGIFKNQAKDYQEAAELDGANQWQIMFKISLPLVSGMFSTIFILGCIALWNDYTFPMLYMPSYPNISYGLYAFSQSMDAEKASITVQFSAAFIVMLPPLLIFVIFRNKIIGKLSINSGIKG